MVVPLQGFQTINDQAEMDYWQDQMKNDELFVQFMTEIFKKKQLEAQRERRNNCMTHPTLIPNTSSPPTAQEPVRQLPSLMDQPIMTPSNQDQYYQAVGSPMVTNSNKHNSNIDTQYSTGTARRALEEASPEYRTQQRVKRRRQGEITPKTIRSNFGPESGAANGKNYEVLPSHVKRAMSNNLPCFYIKFRSTNNTEEFQSLSAMKVAEFIRETISQQSQYSLEDISLLVPVALNRFKIGVKSKKSFLLLWQCKWSSQMDNYEVEVERPRSLPDCCALVVRNVPADLPNEFIYQEITKSISSATSLTKMNYHRQRTTNDFRFCVADEKEYDEIMKIGRIAIGHVLLPITAFQSSLKLTYCNSCWEIGHFKAQCKVGPRCRLCLEPWNRDHKCDKPTKCAQCHGEHLSLSMDCPIIRSYRRTLKEEIEKAMEEGKDKGWDKENAVTSHAGASSANPHPPPNQVNRNKNVWATTQGSTTQHSEQHDNNLLSELNMEVKSILDATRRLENKLDIITRRMEASDKMIVINKQGLMVLTDIVQQTINALIGQKKTSVIQNLASQIDKFKEDFVEKFNNLDNEKIHDTSTTTPNENINDNRKTTDTEGGNNINRSVDAPAFYPAFPITDVKGSVVQRVIDWGFPRSFVNTISEILEEWYGNNTLHGVFEIWEKKKQKFISQKSPLNILLYNVEGWGSRSLETVELICKSDSAICILTEVGELWNSFAIPNFNTFYKEGTNGKGGVMIAVGKHLKVTRIDIDIENTVIVDVDGLSEPIRVVAIYWPQCQQRKFEEISPFIVENTIVAGDFNGTAQEWCSPSTDTRGKLLRSWIEEVNLRFIPGTKNSSKRSDRHIDLIFTNVIDVKAETLELGTSDHWPLVMTSEHIGFQTNGYFPTVNWKAFEVMLQLLQEFWTKELEKQEVDGWYSVYTRFLAALKNRVTTWKTVEKYRPALPPHIIGMLKKVRQIRNRYYRQRKWFGGIGNEEDRRLLRMLTRQTNIEINRYKTENWSKFLSSIQEAHDLRGKAFWSHLARIYKPKTTPIFKLAKNNKVIADQQEITKELYEYYSELGKPVNIKKQDKSGIEIESEYKLIKNALKIDKQLTIEPISLIELKKEVKKLKNKESAGYDLISNRMIKTLPPQYLQCLVNCFNSWLKECRYPEVWKLARIITLSKLNAGIPQTDQTRPISLLPTHSKLFEKIILNRIRYWAETNHLVPREQSGFRPGGLLSTRVLSIYQEIKNELAANMPCLALYFDFKKAYDTVWHAGTIYYPG
ncbi:unnamed protein product [Adineta ricciae]|uniref:Reverse transcriptase domain-containing protein n=1 Tax=Adineta ricciae TaxID=249248 RepID=A0A815IT01_ADIRI|nr:unnamed protein product [Adineta ricciae]